MKHIGTGCAYLGRAYILRDIIVGLVLPRLFVVISHIWPLLYDPSNCFETVGVLLMFVRQWHLD